MKKWMYVIFPGILLVVFLIFYKQGMSQLMHREQVRAESIARQKAEDAERKKEAEEKARVDAAKRQAEQAAEDAKEAKDKEDKWAADSKRIQDDTDKALAETAKYQKEDSDLESQLATLQAAKEQANREDFELVKKLELARVNYENAQLDVERLVAMVAHRADASAMAKMPPPYVSPNKDQ